MKSMLWRKAVLCEIILIICTSGTITGSLTIKTNFSNYTPVSTDDEFDLLIISPKNFESSLQRLIVHKNGYGVRTTLETIEDIQGKYAGKDRAEQLKYCIKYYLDNYHIKYVLLVGGLMGFFISTYNPDNWYVPVRYSYLDVDGFSEPYYLSDLYFADIYFNNSNQFCSWNSNNNSLFGEWRLEERDLIKDERDLIPDVAIGRLPCRNEREVRIMVNKIIYYERSNHLNESWFKRMILVGGDSKDDTKEGYKGIIEGKFANEKAYEWIKQKGNFINISFWPKENDTVSDLSNDVFPENFLEAQDIGSGFTYMVGHGSPGYWYNHPVHGDHYNFSFCRCIPDLCLYLNNNERIPIAVVHACQAAKFDNNLRDNLVYFTFECFCWRYTVKLNGGSIATIGNTAINYGKGGTQFTEIYSGYLSSNFFKVYSENIDILGDIWKEVITRYVTNTNFDMENDMRHAKSVESWVLFGDPSLKIGGYGGLE